MCRGGWGSTTRGLSGAGGWPRVDDAEKEEADEIFGPSCKQTQRLSIPCPSDAGGRDSSAGCIIS